VPIDTLKQAKQASKRCHRGCRVGRFCLSSRSNQKGSTGGLVQMHVHTLRNDSMRASTCVQQQSFCNVNEGRVGEQIGWEDRIETND